MVKIYRMKNFPPENTVSHQYSFKVIQKDIDSLNHVNNVVYLQWINDISEKHWNLITNETLEQHYFWMVLRHEIDYVHQAFLGDEITICTWVGEIQGAKSVRNVHIYKGDDVLVKGKSTWCLIDAKTLRPTRIKEDVLGVLSVKKEN